MKNKMRRHNNLITFNYESTDILNKDIVNKAMLVVEPVSLLFLDKIKEIYVEDEFSSEIEAVRASMLIYLNVLINMNAQLLGDHIKHIKKEFNVDISKIINTAFLESM